jgi:mono/diheme cytochrome c family protein
VYTEAQAERGLAAYNSECARCHGTQLQGGESAPPLAGIEFLSNWNGLTMGDLFERIRISMPADRPGRLSREQNADIIAYMLRVGEFPAGSTELAPRAEALNQIRLDMFRPER